MPYEPHPIFTAPSDPNVKLWRFLDFAKFVSMLQTKSLWFSRADLLGDKFEGSYTMPATEELRRAMPDEADRKVVETIGPQHSKIRMREPSWIQINCWHMNEYESAAMWEIYAGLGKGVAIRTKYARLIDSFVTDESVFVGLVNYIDYRTGYISGANAFSPFLYKRMSFDHERELRAIIARWPPEPGNWAESPPAPPGTAVPIDLDRLVEEVYVAPSSPEWFKETVVGAAATYGLQVTPKQSDLDATAIF